MTDTIKTISALLTTEFQDGQAINSITAQRLRDLTVTTEARSFLSVKQYGATGDGSTDDTTSIANAIAAGAKTVYFPDGTYKVTGLTANVSGQMFIISAGATIKGAASLSNPVISVTANNVTITGGGTIDGNRAGAVAGSAQCIYVTGCTGVNIQSLTIAHTINEAVKGNNCSQLKVRDNFITDTGTTAVFIEVTTTSGTLADVEVSRNYIDRTAESASTITTSGIQIHATGASSILQRTKVIGNTVLLPSNPTSTSTLCIEIFAESHGTVVNNNTCSGASWGISFDTAILGTMTGNTIFGAKQIGLEFAACSRCTMSGNTVDGNGIGQTLLNINDGGSSPIINDYNTIVGNTCYNGAAANDKAVLVFNANGCSFSGNSFKHASSTNQVVYFNGGTNISYSGGIIDGGSTSDTGILFDACTNATVSSVFFQNLNSHPVLAFAEAATTVDNIMVTGCTCVNTGVIISTTGTGTIGNNISAFNCGGSGTVGSSTTNGNARRANCLDRKNDVWAFIGSGSPNSSVTASPGSTYVNQAGGTTTTFYVKESGAATNTGWVAK